MLLREDYVIAGAVPLWEGVCPCENSMSICEWTRSCGSGHALVTGGMSLYEEACL